MSAASLLVLSSLFPSAAQPGAGLFVRERMFRVGARLPLTVVSPRPWFPGQSLIRAVRPGYRPAPAAFERQEGFDVHLPRFLSAPAIGRRFDGFAMAACVLPVLRRLRRCAPFDVIDAHFAYPDGYAAGLLGGWLGVPVTVTMRGTEVRHAGDPRLRPLVRAALHRAHRVFAVSSSLKRLAEELGVDPDRVRVVGNGVDLEKFRRIARDEARDRLGLPRDAPVLISVGALVERKGFHRVIACLPGLLQRHPRLRYLAVGGASPEGDMSGELRAAARRAGVADRVIFTGPLAPGELHVPLSAADVFVLATRNEGWANVFLEAMACGLPVVTTDVGGNAEVVADDRLGIVVPFGDAAALEAALARSLETRWDRERICAHARANSWDGRIDALVGEFAALARHPQRLVPGAASG